MLQQGLESSEARHPPTASEVEDIVARLYNTPTKASSGGAQCRTYSTIPPPGTGLKMLPMIQGLDKKFLGRKMSKDRLEASAVRLHSTQTKNSASRMEHPKVLLYPDRTKLMSGDAERLEAYNQSGTVVNQSMLTTREKWYI